MERRALNLVQCRRSGGAEDIERGWLLSYGCSPARAGRGTSSKRLKPQHVFRKRDDRSFNTGSAGGARVARDWLSLAGPSFLQPLFREQHKVTGGLLFSYQLGITADRIYGRENQNV